MQNKVYMHDQVSNKVNEIMIHLKGIPVAQIVYVFKSIINATDLRLAGFL